MRLRGGYTIGLVLGASSLGSFAPAFAQDAAPDEEVAEDSSGTDELLPTETAPAGPPETVPVPAAATGDAAPPETVLLALETCEGVVLDAAALAALLRVELSIDGVREVLVAGPEPVDGVVAVLHVESAPCDPTSTSFEVRLDDLVTQKHVERTFDFAELPASARARALAIATAELVRASWAELALVEPPPTAPLPIVAAVRRRTAAARGLAAPDTTTVTAPAPEPPPPPRWPRPSIGAAFVVRTYPGGRATILGGHLAADLVPDRLVVLRLDAEVGAGQSLDPLGRIELGSAMLGASVLLALPIGDAITLSLGPRLSGGISWASGQPYDAGTLAGSGLGPLVFLGGSAELDAIVAGPLSLRFGIGVDGALLGFEARVGSIPVAGLTGGGLGGWIGLHLAP